MQVRTKYYYSLLVVVLAGFFTSRQPALAHPMPGSLVNLYVTETSVKGEARVPLMELENAIGPQNYSNVNDTLFRNYFLRHIVAASGAQQWTTVIDSLAMAAGTDSIIGGYRELVVYFELKPDTAGSVRQFSFYYDAVIHQVVTHKAIVYVQQDWLNGIHEESGGQQVGIIALDIPTGKLNPLVVNLGNGSWWKGVKGMFLLGMQHIKEGTDHLLFLLVLLLPSMLLVNQRKWGSFGGNRYSVLNLLRIVTAFTIGHSCTLLLGALGWVRLPGQPVEILIAVSILISAVHAITPLFTGKEAYVAAGFGLVHGLAFAGVLANLKLTAGAMALSIAGFNLGIEVMQLLVVALVVPWFILLSQTRYYRPIRLLGAVLAAVAALGWIAERTTGTGNWVSGFIEYAVRFAVPGIAIVAFVSLLLFFNAKNSRAA